MYYSYGDFYNKNGQNLGYDRQKLAEEIGFEYDSNCFGSGFDPMYDGYELKSIRNCPVKIKLGSNINVQANKLIGFELFASYDSPTENRHVEQFIGNVRLF